jgi:hypothetical protein
MCFFGHVFLHNLMPMIIDMSLFVLLRKRAHTSYNYFIRYNKLPSLFTLPTTARGHLEVTRSAADGQQKVVRFYHKNSYFGEIGLLIEQRRTASVRTLTNTELCILSRSDFDEYVVSVFTNGLVVYLLRMHTVTPPRVAHLYLFIHTCYY